MGSAEVAEEKVFLLKKIQELEAVQDDLKQEVSKLRLSSSQKDLYHHRGHYHNHHKHRSHSLSPQRSRLRKEAPPPFASNKGSCSSSSSPLQRESKNDEPQQQLGAVNLTDRECLNILQSMGHSLHILDLQCRITYWNPSAENLYGYVAAEVLGRDGIELLIDPSDFGLAGDVFNRVTMGESWTGQFLLKNKMGDSFLAAATNTPFYDDDGNLVGIICVSSDSKPFLEIKVPLSGVKNDEQDSGSANPRSSIASKLSLDSEQPLHVALASRLSNLASQVSNRVKSRIWTGENNLDREGWSGESHHPEHSFSDYALADQREDANSSGASTPRGDLQPSPFGVFSHVEEKCQGNSMRDSGDENEGKPIHKIITPKAEVRVQKRTLSWPRRANGREGSDARNVAWPWLGSDQENESVNLKNVSSGLKLETQAGESNQPINNEASGSWSSFNVNSSSSSSSCGSSSSCAANNKADADIDCLDNEIFWDDLTIGEQIGQGSCGTVYHALWYGSDVAVKIFSKQYSDDVIQSFRQEVSVLKRLRHPNILLFMGAVTSPQHLCIVTEFLPRGSLFQMLQKNTTKLDWRRQVHMALDIARGVNYLHHYNPPIIHRDLKSSNILVDKNWTVKVGDFGLSRLKHEAYLTTKTGRGTPQWMAPEALRHEPSDEKSDVYSFGVILWELATKKIPWDTLNVTQVTGTVGFMNHRLEIPEDVDPQWASIIKSCWHSDPASRPTFQELLERFKELQRQYAIQFQASRTSGKESTRKES
ncbi:hypothetical protein RIF29_41122 [Crotalaria pallida]|uniref:non-specific serine/threonine protein kinase n=1 Tax=Crotalaria pallida TaxID=3830 RepID=A0AAN9E4Z0_CROPI